MPGGRSVLRINIHVDRRIGSAGETRLRTMDVGVATGLVSDQHARPTGSNPPRRGEAIASSPALRVAVEIIRRIYVSRRRSSPGGHAVANRPGISIVGNK